MTEANLMDALRDCYVPGTRQSVVTLRLVREATLEHDPTAPGAGIRGVPAKSVARIKLYAPNNDDAVNAQLVALIENRLAGIAEISRSEITLLPALFPILVAG